MRHFLSGIALSALVAFSAPVMAQNLFQPVVYINDQAITRYEVDQRMRFMQVIGGQGVTARAAEDALIADRLRRHAARQMGVELTPGGIEAGMEEFANRGGMDAASFTAALGRAGIEPQVFRDFVEAGTLWRGVVRARVAPRVNVTDAEVEQELRRVIETPIINRVLLSELIIPAPPGQEQQALRLAESIVVRTTSESDFASFARQYSAVPSAPSGGRLDWVALDNLPPTLVPILTALQPGQSTQPLPVDGAVVIFFLRDQQGRLRPGARDQLIDYMTLRVADAGSAASLAANTRYCDDLYVQAGTAAPQVTRQTVSAGAIPTLTGTALASLDPDEAAVIPAPGGGFDVVMLCSRAPALAPLPPQGTDFPVAETPSTDLPNREQVREAIFNRKITAAADGLLAELRADAVIRRP
ncbi:peptidylprolyl isomerase [Paracoccus sp. (in: a-proteobacteria)]|uniref:peptidylprolyl isomerase n=1 Tax=Paracoccus sp. TaxID=267 RepID=UPI0026DFEE6D|nr:peptidylprolyl isomerase [Paracoccus sp. (in: a-proteobacteria)]MDO5648652.1 peptidylprolyl isomerase [Paracoccus sp. (in: a-proteobacteria)]